jgi:hypothetical protein
MGFIIMIDQIIGMDLQDIQELIEHVQNQSIFHDWGNVYKDNAKLLNLNYFKYILNFLKQVKEENEEIFNWVTNVTQGFYSVNYKEILPKLLTQQKKLVYKPKKDKKKKDDVNKTDENKKADDNEGDKNEDVFNTNKNDVKRFKNDVHNGIYDVFDLYDDLIMGVKKREWKTDANDPIREKFKDVPITDIKQDDTTKKKKQLDVDKVAQKDNEELNPHKILTMEELNNEIKKKELKETFYMKKKFNPEEAKFLEEKINDVDETFLQGDADGEGNDGSGGKKKKKKRKKKSEGDAESNENENEEEGKKKRKKKKKKKLGEDKEEPEEENNVEEEDATKKRRKKKKKKIENDAEEENE